MTKILVQDLKEKECNKCNCVKKLDEYYFKVNKKTNTKYYQSFCKKCQSRYNYKQDKDLKLKKAYGISLDEYNELLSKQNGKCAICGVDNNGKYRNKSRALAVDHCHTTGKIRGLLCSDCNTGIGLLKDNVNFLQYAIKYLNKTKN
jgi:hypothetical protein